MPDRRRPALQFFSHVRWASQLLAVCALLAGPLAAAECIGIVPADVQAVIAANNIIRPLSWLGGIWDKCWAAKGGSG